MFLSDAKNKCSVPTCQAAVGDFEVLCPRHWRDVHPAIKDFFRRKFDILELDQRLSPTEAWKATVNKWGVIDASIRLEHYRGALDQVLSMVMLRVMERYVELIKGDKWKSIQSFSKAPALTWK